MTENTFAQSKYVSLISPVTHNSKQTVDKCTLYIYIKQTNKHIKWEYFFENLAKNMKIAQNIKKKPG